MHTWMCTIVEICCAWWLTCARIEKFRKALIAVAVLLVVYFVVFISTILFSCRNLRYDMLSQIISMSSDDHPATYSTTPIPLGNVFLGASRKF